MSDGLDESFDVCQIVVVTIVGGREEKGISNSTRAHFGTLIEGIAKSAHGSHLQKIKKKREKKEIILADDQKKYRPFRFKHVAKAHLQIIKRIISLPLLIVPSFPFNPPVKIHQTPSMNPPPPHIRPPILTHSNNIMIIHQSTIKQPLYIYKCHTRPNRAFPKFNTSPHPARVLCKSTLSKDP